jgi:hypothetical protein
MHERAHGPSERTGSERRVALTDRIRTAAVLLIFGFIVVAVPAGALAQEQVEALAAQCAGANASLSAPCRETALALQAVQGGLGLLASGGAQVPGSASTLGKRFGGLPRFSASVRGAVARIPTPDLHGGGSTFANDPYWGMTGQGSLDVGIFDGFSVIPTVGGILALDVFGSAGVLLLPGGRGFDGNATSWGGGANLGLLRESFTMPGVTVSAAWRRVGDVQLGSRATGDAAEVQAGPTVKSVRAVVGKDLLSLGVLAGVGWDRYSGDGRITVSGASSAVGSATVDGFSSERKLIFGGLSLSMLVLQLSAEGGLARGFPAVPGGATTGYDSGASSFFFSAAGRLTL